MTPLLYRKISIRTLRHKPKTNHRNNSLHLLATACTPSTTTASDITILRANPFIPTDYQTTIPRISMDFLSQNQPQLPFSRSKRLPQMPGNNFPHPSLSLPPGFLAQTREPLLLLHQPPPSLGQTRVAAH